MPGLKPRPTLFWAAVGLSFCESHLSQGTRRMGHPHIPDSDRGRPSKIQKVRIASGVFGVMIIWRFYRGVGILFHLSVDARARA
jgi:hypothetical protein